MYKAFSAITLPVKDGPPKQVAMNAYAPHTPVIDEFAMRVASLLLTNVPVCVLGADDTPMDARLAFIDSVMGLLPYGFRHKMTAATWTRPTLRDHRFRLYFSNAPRSGASDRVVHWGEPPGKVVLPRQVSEYYDWLADKVSPLAQLAVQQLEFRFDNKSAVQALELADSLQYRARHRLTLPLPYAAGRREPKPPAPATAAAVPPGPAASAASPASPDSAASPSLTEADAPAPEVPEDPFEEDIAHCAQYVRAGNGTRLRPVISRLQKRVETAQIDLGHRLRYQEMISEYGLLKPHNSVAKQEDKLYDVLLALGFEQPLTYDGYCAVERCLGIEPGAAPHRSLLAAIERTRMRDPISNAIVLTHLNDQQKLLNWLASGDIDVVHLINLLASIWECPAHAKLLCEVTLTYLERELDLYTASDARASLRGHGFLAQALQERHPGKEQYQIHALYRFLQAAYPSGLRTANIAQVLCGTRNPPTPALLAAVLMRLNTPGDAELAQEAYIYGSLTLMNVDPQTSARLKDRIPHLDPRVFAGYEADPTATPGTQPA